jgi:CHRD domain
MQHFSSDTNWRQHKMNKKFGASAALVASLLFGLATAIPASATIIALEATLDGAQANAGAGTGSPGTGSATMLFDDATNDFSWDISWSNLSAAVIAAHFHGPALPNQNAGVQVDFLTIAPGNPSIGSTVINNAQAADLLAGLWYINIHTQAFPPGEIRGQVQVPEPSVISLMLGTLAGLVYLRRQRVEKPARIS